MTQYFTFNSFKTDFSPAVFLGCRYPQALEPASIQCYADSGFAPRRRGSFWSESYSKSEIVTMKAGTLLDGIFL